MGKSPNFLFALVCFAFLFSDLTFASNFIVGLGGDYEQVSFSENAYNSTYQGPGGSLEGRLRLWPNLKAGFGLDISGHYSRKYLSNVSVTEEKGVSTIYGGGLDLTFRWLFAGVTYSKRKLGISMRRGGLASLSFATFGGRAGVMVPLTEKINISAKFAYEQGSLVQPTLSGLRVLDVQSTSGSILVHLSLAGGS